jgi:hypothetical protein
MTIAYNIQEWSTLFKNISRYGFEDFDYLINSLSFIIVPVLITSVIYTVFSWILQKRYGFKKKDTTKERRTKEGFQFTVSTGSVRDVKDLYKIFAGNCGPSNCCVVLFSRIV